MYAHGTHLCNRHFYGSSLFLCLGKSTKVKVEIHFTYHWKSLDQNAVLESNDFSSLVSFVFSSFIFGNSDFEANLFFKCITITRKFEYTCSLQIRTQVKHKHARSLPSLLFIFHFILLFATIRIVLRNLCYSNNMMVKKINSLWRMLWGNQDLIRF